MQFFDLATTTLGATSKPVELKIPLWWADGGGVQGGTTTTSGSFFLQDGVSGFGGSTTSSQTSLFTLSSKWSANTQFAFEATFYSALSKTANLALWDMTNNTLVISSQVSTTLANPSVIRSGSFTLTSGHVYGVTVWNSENTTYVNDASLIVFPS